MPDGTTFPQIIGAVAKRLLGEPNPVLSNRDTWRYGQHGSLAIEVGGEKAGTWFDHESKCGGGVADLVKRELRLKSGEVAAWLHREVGMAPPARGNTGAGRIVATYDYHAADAALRFQVVRREPKAFQQRQPDGAGGWIWKMKGVELVPYRLPELIAAPADAPVFIVEGEKDVDALRALGLVATCNAGGAGKWRREYSPWFQGRAVVLLPDNDPQAKDSAGNPRHHQDGRPVLPGQDHAADVARSLAGCAASVRILSLPGLPLKGDVSDWLAAGGTAEALLHLAKGVPTMEAPVAAPKARRKAPRMERDPDAPEPIRLRGGHLHEEATAGEAAIISAGRPIYQRGTGLVRPALQVVPAAHGRTTNSASLVEITAHGLIDQLCSVATWERFDSRSDDWVQVNPPMSVAQTILSRMGEWQFQRIAGVINTPTLRPDGSILAEPGYDEATRLFHMADPHLRLHPATRAPTRSHAEKALALLSRLLTEFPFVDQVSRAVALSGLITPVVRGALSVAPLHAFKAYTAGTGKSYLADVASAISTGRPCPVASAAPDEAETEKRIAGLLLAGFPICSLDNVNGELGGDLLCQAIERPLVRLRPLGRSDIVEVESRATLFATGNNLRVRGDMVRRTVVCSLDAGVERPELREFKADPVVTVLADRNLYVSACIIIVRAYEAAGLPGRLKPIASFGDWSDRVRSALVWLGCEDPAKSMEEAREDDPELTDLREVTGLWHEAIGADAMTIREISQMIERREESRMGEPTDYRFPDLREALLRLFGERGELNARRLGKWLLAREGRIVAGLRIKRGLADGHEKVQRWRVERCS
jgi:putative DNA primase/helicase